MFGIEASGPGFALNSNLDVEDGHVFVLERAVWVELSIPNHIELPEPPLFLSVSLGRQDPEGMGANSSRTVGQDVRGEVHDLWFDFGPSHRVAFAIPGPDRYEINWWVSQRDPGSGASKSHSSFETPPRQVIQIEEGVERALFDIEPPEGEYEEALRKATKK
jgi:hypothetical protein